MRRIIWLFIIICCSGLGGCAQKTTDTPKSQQSFFQLVGETDWKLSLNDFAVSLEKEGNIFELRVQGRHSLRYRAQAKGDTYSGRFGPLQTEHAAELSGLLEYALRFVEQERNAEFAINVNWEMYPQSILKWAKVWQDSELRKKWDSPDQHIPYQKLTEKIADFMEEDMKTIVRGLGFEPTGVSMEKLTYQKARQLKYYKEVLEPAGISQDLKIPIPLILYVLLKPYQEASAEQAAKPKSTYPITVDYIAYATAEANSATVYAAFRRASLDEYEISGSLEKPNGVYYARIFPMSQKEYQSIAGQLLKACLQATKGDERDSFSLRLNLSQYPEVYQEVVKRFTFSPEVAKKTAITRPELTRIRFYEYTPLPASGFQAAINPFLEQIEYKFSHLQISVESKLKAGKHPEYEEKFKPFGIKPEDKLVVPELVYMVVEKKR